MIELIIIFLGLLTLSIMLSLTFRDKLGIKTAEKSPFVSFIVPAYNKQDYVEKCLNSIASSYPKSNYEIIVVDDKSSDNTLSILKKLKKKYSLRIVENKKNQGKAKSLNNVSKLAKGDFLFFVDADTIITKEYVQEAISRLSNKAIAGVCGNNRIIDKGALASMQDLELGMLNFIQISSNFISTPSFWGGCIAVRKKDFLQVGKFCETCFTEDQNLSLRLQEIGFKTQQTHSLSFTHSEPISRIFKQKIRWAMGGMQNTLDYSKTIGRNLLVPLFFIAYFLIDLLILMSFVSAFVYPSLFYQKLAFSLSLCFFFIPFIRSYKQVLLIFPFALIYWPLFMLTAITGFIKYLVYKLTKNEKRAW